MVVGFVQWFSSRLTDRSTPATSAPVTSQAAEQPSTTTLGPTTTAAPTTTTPANYPVANTDTYIAEQEDLRTFRVLDNDDSGDFKWDYTTLSFYSEPSHAQTWRVAEANPRLKYMAANDYEGPDSFKYVICNTSGQCAIGRVLITVVDN